MMIPQFNRIVPVLVRNKELIFLFILACIFFFPVIIHPDQMIYPPGNVAGSDVTAQYSFWRSFFASTIVKGEGIPYWNPYVFSGTPFIGNPLSAMFYPFTWLFVIFNPDLVFGWLFFIDVLLIGIFTFIFARTINMSKPASFFSAVTFMFSGTILLRIYAGHLSNLDAIVWFPLVLIFYERSFSHNRYINGAGAGISLALMFLSGNLQFALYGACSAVVYLIGRIMMEKTLPTRWEKCRHFLVMLLVSLGICVILSAVQTLPAWEFSQLSNRGGGVSFDFSSEYSLPPSNLITILVPDAFGNPLGPIPPVSPFPMVSYWELCFYIGILPLFLIILGVLYNRTRWSYLFLAIAVLALLFSLGRFFPLYGLIYHYVPGFSQLRIPASMLFVCTFSLALLAGFGFDAIFEPAESGNKRCEAVICSPGVHLASVCIAAAGGILIAVLFLENMISPPYLMPVIFVWIAFTAVFCFAPLFLKKGEAVVLRRKLLMIMLISILIADLFVFGIRFIDTKSPAEVYKNPGFIPVIKNETDPYFRIYDETGLLNQDIAYRNNLYLINGYDPTWLEEYRTFFIQSQPGLYNAGPESWNQGALIENFDILRLLNVRYIVTNRHYDNYGITGLQCVYDYDSVLVYRLNFTYPRAYMIPESEFENKTPISVKPADIEKYSPNTIIVNVTTSAPEYLILSEVYYPGWTARDNAEPKEIVRYQGIFRAIYLNPGPHRVTFTYFPEILTL